MDTKLKADIAEYAVITQLLKRGFNVLKPVGDRLAYDLAVDINGRLVRIQVKHAWYDSNKQLYLIDNRRTQTNRRHMKRKRYDCNDFDFAIIYVNVENTPVFYVMPVSVFISYSSSISFVETNKRQRAPKSANYREKFELLSAWAASLETDWCIPVKFGEALTGNTEPSLAIQAKKV